MSHSRRSGSSLPSQSTHGAVPTLSQLKYLLTELSKSPEVIISSLSSDSPTYRRYVRAYGFVMSFYEAASKEEYQQLLDFIGTLPRPAKIMPGSFGSFLFGCLYDTQDGDMMCAPACHNSIPPSVDVKPCSLQIWMYLDGRLVYRSGVGDEANVFQYPAADLSPEDMSILQSNKVTRANLYSSSGTLLASKPINPARPNPIKAQNVATTAPTPAALPINQGQPVIQQAAIAGTANGGISRGATSIFSDWRIILLIIVVILAIIVFVYLVYRAANSNKAQEGYIAPVSHSHRGGHSHANGKAGAGYIADGAGQAGMGYLYSPPPEFTPVL